MVVLRCKDKLSKSDAIAQSWSSCSCLFDEKIPGKSRMFREEEPFTIIEPYAMVQSLLVFREGLICDANCHRMPSMCCDKFLQMGCEFPKVRSCE